MYEGFGDDCHGKLLWGLGEHFAFCRLFIIVNDHESIIIVKQSFQIGMIQSYVMNDGKQDVLTVVSEPCPS